MKYLSTKFEDYINECQRYNLHPNIEKILKKDNNQNIILYGAPGIGKYTQALHYIKNYSPTQLKYERKLNYNFNNKKNYVFKISDIHIEIDMSLLGCNSKVLFNDLYHQILDIFSTRENKFGIILCKNFHKIHSELLEIFYSYMQNITHKNIKIMYIIITEHISFIPSNILIRCNTLSLNRPNKSKYSLCVQRQLKKDIIFTNLLVLIEHHRITHLNMVPIMFNRLLKLPESVRDSYDVSSLQFVAHAAAPVSPPIKRAMIEWWGPVINEYYGSTEMGNVTFCTAEEWLAHPGSVGRPMPDAVVRVIDDEGKDLPPREIGEVIGRTKGSVDFTYQNDDEKRRRMEKAGLVTPGDMGYFDEDGFLYLCDRANDMVISGGVNIYPAEIEAELHKITEIADCAVFGIPDDEFGEALCAYIQLQPDATLTESALREQLRETVAGYKMPKVWEFVLDLPREDSGKIFKRKLRELYWEGHDRRI